MGFFQKTNLNFKKKKLLKNYFILKKNNIKFLKP